MGFRRNNQFGKIYVTDDFLLKKDAVEARLNLRSFADDAWKRLAIGEYLYLMGNSSLRYTGGALHINFSATPVHIDGNLHINLETILDAETVNVDQDVMPNVDGHTSFLIANSLATTITGFIDGVEGQKIILRFADGNTTVTHGANIFLSGGANKNFAANQTLVLVKRAPVVPGATWYQIGGEI